MTRQVLRDDPELLETTLEAERNGKAVAGLAGGGVVVVAYVGGATVIKEVGQAVLEEATGVDLSMIPSLNNGVKQVIKNASKKSVRPVGSIFESVNDVLTNPKLLAGKTPAEVQAIIGKTPGWKIETLGKGSKKGQGWVFREYTEKGDPTGQSLRWHPGGSRKGGLPYWRVTSNVVGKSDVIR